MIKAARRVFLPVALAGSLIGFWCAVALADASGAASSGADAPPVTLPGGWAGFAILVLTVGSYLARKFTRSATGKFAAFLHSTGGAAVTGLAGAIVPLVVQSLQHGFNLPAVEAAIIGGALNFVAVDNASNSGAEQATKVAAMRATASTGPGPTITKVSAMIPLAFSMALLSSLMSTPGCATLSAAQKAQTTAFTQCLEQKGISAAPSVGTQAWQDLSSGASEATIVAQLEQLAGTAGIDAVVCAVQAWLTPAPAAVDGGAPVKAEQNPAGVAAAKTFLGKHGVKLAGL